MKEPSQVGDPAESAAGCLVLRFLWFPIASIFQPSCYLVKTGQAYLTENLLITYGRPPSVQAQWIPASASFTRWFKPPLRERLPFEGRL